MKTHVTGYRRFIPTGVGNGFLTIIPVKPPAGSSPRVWGTETSDYTRFRQLRFIPTGVGTGGYPCMLEGNTKVHPHGCGERI